MTDPDKIGTKTHVDGAIIATLVVIAFVIALLIFTPKPTPKSEIIDRLERIEQKIDKLSGGDHSLTSPPIRDTN